MFGIFVFVQITLSTSGRDDDVFIDRLNYKYSTLILFVSSLTITVKILQSDHIQCWVSCTKKLSKVDKLSLTIGGLKPSFKFFCSNQLITTKYRYLNGLPCNCNYKKKSNLRGMRQKFKKSCLNQ